jgi:hypothetical protein
LIPTSLPIVELKLFNVVEVDRDRGGRFAAWAAIEVSTTRKYEVFSLALPEPLRAINMLEAA